jgi:ABC-type transporter Mla MlaB component
MLVAAWPLATHTDLAIVNALARLQLAARSLGWSIRIANPDDQLRALVAFVGLSDVLPLESGR